jgi:hypothetical protein
MKQYFIHNGESEMGPYIHEQLKTMNLKGDTPIWHDGLTEWATLKDINELKDVYHQDINPPKYKTAEKPPRYQNHQSTEETVKATGKKSSRKYFVLGGLLIAAVLAIFYFTQSASSEEIKPLWQQEMEDQTTDLADSVEILNNANIELTKKNREFRNNFEKYIQAVTNKYSYDPFGGITNLDIIVRNDTDYMLDEVIVNVDYIKDNKGIYKTEAITLYNIPAHQDKSVSAPNSNRGTSIAVSFENIVSKQLHFHFYMQNGIGTYTEPEFTNDPYFVR